MREPGTLTRVVNLRFSPFDVYIGRPGNGRDGYFGNPFRLVLESKRAEVLQMYEAWFYERLARDQDFLRRVLELRGKVLGCFCKPSLCHGDIIADYLNNL